MIEHYYRVGTIAQLLGTSKHVLRRLWEAGLLDGRLTPGGHLTIPKSEVVRLQKSGIPALPNRVETDAPDENVPSNVPEEAYISAADNDRPTAAVQDSFDQVTITQNRVQKRKLDLEVEEVEDLFRDREMRANADGEAKKATEKQQRERTESLQHRNEWELGWQQYAIDCVDILASDAPPEAKLEVPGCVAEALKMTSLQQSNHVVQSLVRASVEKALAPWRRQQKITKAVEEASDQLPSSARSYLQPTKWQLRAKQGAYQAVRQLGESASLSEIIAVARQAVDSISLEFEHECRCERIVLCLSVASATFGELAEAKELVKAYLSRTQVGSTIRQLERVRDDALQPLRERIALREDREMRHSVIARASLPWDLPQNRKTDLLRAVQKAFDQLPSGTARARLEEARDHMIQSHINQHQERKKKEDLIHSGLNGIPSYLQELETDWEFDKSTQALKRELEQPIRRRLEHLLTGNESPVDVADVVRKLICRELGVPVRGQRNRS